jgi:hypothetical protein
MPRIIFQKRIDKESLTTKSSLIFIGLTAVCGGYILFLAVAAPQQLAEATTAATNVVCNGCVGSSDIGDGSIQSVDIANGQVGSVDIGQGQVTSGDIQDGTIRSADLGNFVTIVQGFPVSFAPGESGSTNPLDCPSGKIVTGGGYSATGRFQVRESRPVDANSWVVGGLNTDSESNTVTPYAVCA